MRKYRQLYRVQLWADLLTSSPAHLYFYITIHSNSGHTVRLHQNSTAWGGVLAECAQYSAYMYVRTVVAFVIIIPLPD